MVSDILFYFYVLCQIFFVCVVLCFLALGHTCCYSGIIPGSSWGENVVPVNNSSTTTHIKQMNQAFETFPKSRMSRPLKDLGNVLNVK